MTGRADAWMTLAACLGMGPQIFFPERGQSQAPGKKVCARCPVTKECRAYADAVGAEDGMWGGELRSRGNHRKNPQPELETPVMIPKSLSATAVQVYLDCPKRFEAEKINYATMPSGDAAELGTACHSTLETWVADGWHKRTYGSRQAMYDAALAIYGEAYWRVLSDGTRYDEGWELVKSWLDRQDWSGREVISTESKESFEVLSSVGPIKFNFIMDRLDRLITSDGSLELEIVDYKSQFKTVSPAALKGKVQTRIYALAVQLKFPEAERIWMTLDMLRYEPVGVVFTKEENRATYRWLHELVERIIQDTDPRERLNADCQYCVRKSECKTLGRHIAAGGPLGITDAGKAAARHLEITHAIKALGSLQAELAKVVLAELEREDATEKDYGEVSVSVSVSSRRGIDPDRLRAAIGEARMGKFGSIKMSEVDALLKSDELSPEEKDRVRSLISRQFGDADIKVTPKALA